MDHLIHSPALDKIPTSCMYRLHHLLDITFNTTHHLHQVPFLWTSSIDISIMVHLIHSSRIHNSTPPIYMTPAISLK